MEKIMAILIQKFRHHILYFCVILHVVEFILYIKNRGENNAQSRSSHNEIRR